MHYPQITGTQKNFVFDWIVQKIESVSMMADTHTQANKLQAQQGPA